MSISYIPYPYRVICKILDNFVQETIKDVSLSICHDNKTPEVTGFIKRFL